MRRGLEIRVAFAPTRLSAEHLHAVYEMVTPIVDRAVVRQSEKVADERDLRAELALRKRGTRWLSGHRKRRNISTVT